MKVTIDGITYEGTEEEMRRIVYNPPHSPAVKVVPTWPNGEYPRNWDGSPRVTCKAGAQMKDKKVVRPKCCGECRRYFRDPDNKGRGWCDNWGGVLLHDEDVCHPNLGIRKDMRCKNS